MNGKTILLFLLGLTASNGFWFCATQQIKLDETPLLVVPIVASVAAASIIGQAIYDNW